ncbi:MAG: TA system VapC family ribonuclease toxin [Trueperaceae bacterium]
MTLLDANALIALVVAEHVHHDAAEAWLERAEGPFATCPFTQTALLRFLVREGWPARDAATLLVAFVEHPRHEFWPADLGAEAIAWDRVDGHRQVTDAYLAALARAKGGRLATLDRRLAAVHPDVAEWIGGR